MKSIRTVALISAIIPLALIAQSGTGSSSGQTRPGTGQTNSSQTGSGQLGSTPSSGTHAGSMSSGSASRVTKDSLKSQVTAKKLLGKDVYDNSGKKVGSVEDIVLQGSGSSLSRAFMNRDSSSAHNAAGGSLSGSASSSGSQTGAVGSARTGTSASAGNASSMTPGSTGSGTGAYAGSSGTTSGSGVAGTSSGSTGSQGDWSAQSGRSSAQETAVIISTGGFAGMGSTMLRVPMSQLSYDSSEERFTLAMSEAELNQLKDSGDLAARGN